MKPDFASADWLPLNDAFEQARRCLGSGELAAGRLHQVLLDGQLTSGQLQLPPIDGVYFVRSTDGEQRHILGPEFWRQVQGFTYGNGAVRVVPVEGCRVSGYWHFFVLRSDLDRLFPVTAKADETKPPRRRPGPVTTHDWHAIDGEIARRCIDPKTRQLQVPKNESKLANAVLEWCQDQFGREPAESEMREAVRRICAALRQV
jgi:hypothetical protein